MWSLPSADRDSERLSRASRLWTHARRRVVAAHKRPVDGLAWNSTGTRLASCSRDASVRVWSFDCRRELSAQPLTSVELAGHTSDVEKVCWNPSNPDQLATCSADKSIRLWDCSSGAQLHALATIGENIHIRWSPDGRHIVFCNNNNMLSLVAFSAGGKPQVVKSVGFKEDINAIEWDRSSERVILGYQKGTVEVVQVPSLTTVASIPCHSATIYNVLFDSKYKYLATGAADSVVNLWNAAEMVCVRSFARMDDCIRAVSFSGDSQLIAIGGKDLKIEVADVESGSRVHVFDIPDETLALAFHPSAHVLAVSVGDKKKPGEILLINAMPAMAQPAAAAAEAGAAAASSSSSSSSGPAAAASSSVKVDRGHGRRGEHRGDGRVKAEAHTPAAAAATHRNSNAAAAAAAAMQDTFAAL